MKFAERKKIIKLGRQAYKLGLPCVPEDDENFKAALPNIVENGVLFIELYFAWEEGWKDEKLNQSLSEWAEDERRKTKKLSKLTANF